MSKFLRIGFSALLFACSMPLFAQTGCTNSPENPTVILAIVGGAGAFLSSLRLRSRR